MAISRRDFVTRGAALAALQTVGTYGLLERLATIPARAATATAPPEQHLLQGVQVVTNNGLDVIVPPLHHQVVTAKLRTGTSTPALTQAQEQLEAALQQVEQRFAPTPDGLGVTVGWGVPYFENYVPTLGDGTSYPGYLPFDKRAGSPALLDSPRFDSDPAATILEANDLVLLLRSDSLDNIAKGSRILFDGAGELFDIQSVRRGFVGSNGLLGQRSLTKQMAMAAGIPGGASIPETAELFLGFTSTQKKALGPDLIANFETLPGLTDQYPNGYFARGTTMHLSHLYEDLATWYGTLDYEDRVTHTFSANTSVPRGTQTVPEGPDQVETETAVKNEVSQHGRVGHSSSLQPATRLGADTTDNYGTLNPRGTAIPQRADFNTLDNPFFWSAQPSVDGQAHGAAAGLHFVVFAPTSDAFHRGRRAMDGRYADGTSLNLDRSHTGFNSVLTTTHRQNFLVPPRARRSFPLAERL